MTRKILLDMDPGPGDAVALCLALSDARLDVVAITATGGIVRPEQATRNVQAIVEHLDPPRWPRIGAADSAQPLRTDARDLFGPDGLGGAELRVAELHHRHPSPKVLSDEIRGAPSELTIIACGPLSNLAAVLRLESELATQVGHLIIVGGTLDGPGNVTAAAEFNMYCDAEAARKVIGSPITTTLVPLDVTGRVQLDFGLLDRLSRGQSRAGRVLERILPAAFRAYRQRLGLESIYVHEAVAVALALHPEIFQTERLFCDVETAGEITHGATVFDRRQVSADQPNVDVVVDLDVEAAIDCIVRTLLGTA